METAVFAVNAGRAAVKVRRPLVLGSSYAVEIDGYEYGDTPPTVILAWHGGEPLAVSEISGDAHTISLATRPLLDAFKSYGRGGCPTSLTVHCYVMTGDSTLAEGFATVLWAPYLAGGETITRIDVKGPKGDKGDPGEPGARGPQGEPGIVADSPIWFTVDHDPDSDTYGHLFVHARDAKRLYATDAQGNEDTDKPLWTYDSDPSSDTYGHIFFHFYSSDGSHRPYDLGYVKGSPGEQGAPGPSGPADETALGMIAALRAALSAAAATPMPENPQLTWNAVVGAFAAFAAALEVPDNA